ncbi:MAG: 2Fe-2S iron-sulfur cluster-binding protein [Actinomycetota bacterium]
MSTDQSGIRLTVDGNDVTVGDVSGTLLDLLRDQLRITEVKDGCSPQGQCGCCTVLVDGQPRVACVTPVRRVSGRTVITAAGLEPGRQRRWQEAFLACGASQCGFCTPGIVTRLDALERSGKADGPGEHEKVDQALLAHLCRCTGWQTIHEAWDVFRGGTPVTLSPSSSAGCLARADETPPSPAERRATIEGGTPQRVGPDVILGHGRFAVDEAPADALVAVGDGAGGWVVGENLRHARELAGKVQGRRTTVGHDWPIEVPAGEWDATLRTTWVEPAYLETDASWCAPGGEPYSPVANGGAFGAKLRSPVAGVARALADEHGRTVLVLASREDATRLGAKRPPMAGGAMADGTGELVVATTPGIAEAVAAVAPGLQVTEIDTPGPPTSAAIRAAGWAEAVALLTAAGARPIDEPIVGAAGGRATAEVVTDDHGDPVIRVGVACGHPLDEVVLRSYAIGAAHMAWSWVAGEALSVDADGMVHDLTVRSFGVTRAVDTPRIEVAIEPGDGPAVNGSDAVFVAVTAASWRWLGGGQDWPLGSPTSRS